MATTQDFIEFVVEQIRGNYDVRYKKMFGEYMVYVNEKPVLIVCNNCVFVKQADQIAELMQNAEVGFPYKGAKEHYILDVEDIDLTASVIQIMESITPIPKKKVKK
ncbi:MAG: TfoX/Sxy family protein [Clostridia bacterium]|nr:TfoX/Sxy family protein [Clostridia bacterium]